MSDKPSKMIIIREERRIGPYLFRSFLVSLGSASVQNISAKTLNHLERFSCELILEARRQKLSPDSLECIMSFKKLLSYFVNLIVM